MFWQTVGITGKVRKLIIMKVNGVENVMSVVLDMKQNSDRSL